MLTSPTAVHPLGGAGGLASPTGSGLFEVTLADEGTGSGDSDGEGHPALAGAVPTAGPGAHDAGVPLGRAGRGKRTVKRTLSSSRNTLLAGPTPSSPWM